MRHAKAVGEGNVQTAYTEDAVVRPANIEPVRGKAELENFSRRWFGAMRVRDASYTTEELDVYEDRAYHIGAYTGAYQPHGKETVPDRGSFMIVGFHAADPLGPFQKPFFLKGSSF